MSVFIDRFFPVKLDLLFSPSPFLQCDWWSSQWGRGESRGSQKGWGMMFDAPCIYQISKFAIINLNLLCFFGTNGSFWNLDLQKEIPSQRETQPPRAEKKLPSWYSSRCYSLLCLVWWSDNSHYDVKKKRKNVTVYFV